MLPSYQDLFKEGRSLADLEAPYSLRLAILADSATDFLIPVLRALAARRHCKLDIFAAPFDVFEPLILNPQSDLYSFHPDFILIFFSSQRIKEQLYKAEDRSLYAAQFTERMTALWSGIRTHSSCRILQSNLPHPLERAYGNNFEQTISHSLGGIFDELNRRLVENIQRNNDVFLFDIANLANDVGRIQWSDERLWSLCRCSIKLDFLPLLASRLLDLLWATSGHAIKCIATDLDNVLWGGAIGDDGLEGILLGDYDAGNVFVNFQRFLLELKRRGIILAVISKNDEQTARLPFQQHPSMVLKESDFAVFIANWEPKPQNILRLQEKLNIDLSSIVFLDDRSFERNAVRSQLPSVIVPELPEDPALYLQTLSDMNLFEVGTRQLENIDRTAHFKNEAKRIETKALYENEDDYLASLKMKACIKKINQEMLPRVLELSNRSHQFNLMTRHYTQEDYERFMTGPSFLPLACFLSDRYGELGLIAVCLLRCEGSDLVVEELFISCRALGRGVEALLVGTIVDQAVRSGARSVIGKYRPNGKNDHAALFYERHGFRKEEAVKEETHWILSPLRGKPYKTHIIAIEDFLIEKTP